MRTSVIVDRAQLVARTRADGHHVYRKEGKAALVAACAPPGASVAAIALAHGVNANLLRKWITRSHTRNRTDPEQRPEARAHFEVGSPAAARTSPSQFFVVELEPTLADRAILPVVCPAAAPTPAINAPGTISIQLGEARIDVGGVVEREALQRVIDCLRESSVGSSIGAPMNIGATLTPPIGSGAAVRHPDLACRRGDRHAATYLSPAAPGL